MFVKYECVIIFCPFVFYRKMTADQNSNTIFGFEKCTGKSVNSSNFLYRLKAFGVFRPIRRAHTAFALEEL